MSDECEACGRAMELARCAGVETDSDDTVETVVMALIAQRDEARGCYVAAAEKASAELELHHKVTGFLRSEVDRLTGKDKP